MDQNSGVPVTDATNATDSSADFNINIQDQLGVPPAPPIPDFLTNGPGMPGVNSEVMADLTNNGPAPITGESVNQAEPVTSAPSLDENTAPVVAPIENTAVVGGDDSQFEEVKKQMLQDLYPLMDKIKMQPEQKFKVYKQMIETAGSKEMITSAYEAVKEIGNEEARAEALLFLVEKADS